MACLKGASTDFFTREGPERLQVIDHAVIFVDHLYLVLLCEIPPCIKAFGRWTTITTLILNDRIFQSLALTPKLSPVLFLRLLHESWYRMFSNDILVVRDERRQDVFRAPRVPWALFYHRIIQLGVITSATVKANLHKNKDNTEHEDISAVPTQNTEKSEGFRKAHDGLRTKAWPAQRRTRRRGKTAQVWWWCVCNGVFSPLNSDFRLTGTAVPYPHHYRMQSRSGNLVTVKKLCRKSENPRCYPQSARHLDINLSAARITL